MRRKMLMVLLALGAIAGFGGGRLVEHLLALNTERKTLLVAGAAGGMAAIFSTPLAAVLLAVELLLFEWKPRSLVPVALASVTATILRREPKWLTRRKNRELLTVNDEIGCRCPISRPGAARRSVGRTAAPAQRAGPP